MVHLRVVQSLLDLTLNNNIPNKTSSAAGLRFALYDLIIMLIRQSMAMGKT